MTFSDSVRKLVEEGAEAVAKREWEKAVDAYSEACQVFNLETGDDSGELLVMYAKALIENGIVHNDVIGGQQEEEEVEEVEEEKDGKFQFCEEEEEEEKGDKNVDNGPSDFEIAMEILDVAKAQFEQRGDDEAVANVHVLQGDIYLETEQAVESLKSYNAAVEMLKSGRKLAETLVMLSIAQELNGETGKAVESMKKAITEGGDNWKRKVELVTRLDELEARYRDEIKEEKRVRDLAKRVAECSDLTNLVKRKKK